MSNRNAQVVTVLAGAAALAGVGYALAYRSAGRSGRGPRRGRGARSSAVRPPDGGEAPRPAPTVIVTEPPTRIDADRISSAPDALDVALDLEGVFDGKSASGVAVTARPNEHVPAPRTGDDDDAPSPDDLGLAWLAHATESERSLGTADTIPDVEDVPPAMDEQDDESEASADDVDDDETTAEYVRTHRISRNELSAAIGKKQV